MPELQTLETNKGADGLDALLWKLRALREASDKPLSPNLTVAEFALVTGLSKSKVYGLVEDKVIAAVRLPGCSRILIPVAALEDYLAGARPSEVRPRKPKADAGGEE
jgi:excisionase family DNA binding protein